MPEKKDEAPITREERCPKCQGKNVHRTGGGRKPATFIERTPAQQFWTMECGDCGMIFELVEG